MEKTCECCGAKMVEYRHSFNYALAFCLHRIYLEENPVNIKTLDLHTYQWNNFQKLQYWGLVEKAFDHSGDRIKGMWSITERGIKFVEGRIKIRKSVWTYRSEPLRADGNEILFDDVHDKSFKRASTYAEESLAHREEA